MTKIKIGNKSVQVKCSGALPRIYGRLFNRELFADIQLFTELSDFSKMSPEARETLENITYAMAYHANKDIKPIYEWLEDFGLMDILNAAPEVFEVWMNDNKTQATPKKGKGQ